MKRTRLTLRNTEHSKHVLLNPEAERVLKETKALSEQIYSGKITESVVIARALLALNEVYKHVLNEKGRNRTEEVAEKLMEWLTEEVTRLIKVSNGLPN